MKKLFIIISLACLATVASHSENILSDDNKKETTTKSGNQEVTFYVDFHCMSCVRRAEKELEFMKGVVNRKVSLQGKSINITYDPKKTNEETLFKALEDKQFAVKKTRAEMESSGGGCGGK